MGLSPSCASQYYDGSTPPEGTVQPTSLRTLVLSKVLFRSSGNSLATTNLSPRFDDVDLPFYFGMNVTPDGMAHTLGPAIGPEFRRRS